MEINNKHNLKSHQANDKAVMQAYGFWGKLNTESEKDLLAVLFDKYARAIINSITVVSAVELKIKWLDDSVTEIRREL